MDAETSSVFDTRAKYQVKREFKGGFLFSHLRERLTDLGGPADLNGGTEELGGLEVTIITITTKTTILIITIIVSKKANNLQTDNH